MPKKLVTLPIRHRQKPTDFINAIIEYNNKFWEELIRLLSLHKSFI
jgi:hypothetical protein